MNLRTKPSVFLFILMLAIIGCRNDTIKTSSIHQIVYVSYAKGSHDGEIYVMNEDGSGQTRLTKNEADDYDPAWSPDGQKIAFSSNRDGLTRIYIMNKDGSEVHRLTNLQDLLEVNPAWSPNGKWIVFKAIATDGRGESTLQMVDLASREVNKLVESEYIPHSPVWSPDSRYVWFVSFIDQITVTRSDLYTVEIDSGNIQRATFNGSEGWGYDDLKISPDGQWILHNPSARYPRAFVLDLQTFEVSQAFDYNEYKEIYPDLVDEQLGANWSPDGSGIIFSMTKSEHDIYADLYSLDFQTKQITQLTNASGHQMSADWWAPSN